MASGETFNCDMLSELERLKTYSHWPRSAPVMPGTLAKAGFYYLGQSDKVRCAFCGGILKNWQIGDDPFTEHSKHYKECTFIQGKDKRNIPLSVQETCNAQAGGGKPPQLHNHASGRAAPTLFTGLSTPLNPRHPDFQSRDTREATFHGWPSHVTQRPHNLAHAGFFYSGEGDSVHCFCCDGALRNWEEGDDPWEEHARWFPDCKFVLQQKGPTFIQEIAERHRVLQNLEEQTRSQLPTYNFEEVHMNPQHISMDDEDILRTRAAKTALDMGFPHSLVITTYRQLLTLNDQLPSAENVISALLGDNLTVVEPQVPGERASASSARLPPINPSSERQISQSSNPGDSDRTLCKICMDREVAVTFLPCGHLVCCFECASHVKECPICRRIIKANFRTFLA